MKHVYVNLKRFDISPEKGGVNNLAPVSSWASTIIEGTEERLGKYQKEEVEFVFFFPEAHLLSAAEKTCLNSAIRTGCQGVYRKDTSVGGNFGAFTTNLTANAAVEIGCGYTLIGHCEERNAYEQVLSSAGLHDTSVINQLLNESARCASAAGLKILYCIGEKAEEQDRWQEVLKEQLERGLEGLDQTDVCIAYEPVWAIGPGKTPPDKAYITRIARFIKEVTGGADVVYGGGLKEDNAQMLASIEEIDGGLIALTQFTGKIGFYPDGFLRIVETYLGK